MFRIGHIPVDPPLVLAPMAGVTDRDFRLIVRRMGGVGVVTMEFISSKGLMRRDPLVLHRLSFSEEERPLSIQIYGSDGPTMAEAAREVEQRGADVCDINMGCPANKVLKGCAGAALMGDLKLAERIIADVRKAISIPLTVKFRVGLDDRRKNYLELGRICEANGVAAVALHPRTARQKFTGSAAWRHIAALKEAVSIPVIGNGDVVAPEDALQMIRETGCDGVMIGRGATRNPWIFSQTAALLSNGELPQPTWEDRRDLILDHFRTVIAREEPKFARYKLQTFTGLYSKGLPNSLGLRRQIHGLQTPENFLEAIERFFEQLILQQAA
ncbi:MAG: tRNA dihydrouridine synthase DusB [Acidobacteriota bacterium]